MQSRHWPSFVVWRFLLLHHQSYSHKRQKWSLHVIHVSGTAVLSVVIRETVHQAAPGGKSACRFVGVTGMWVLITLVMTLSQHHDNEMIKCRPPGARRRPFFHMCIDSCIRAHTAVSWTEWGCVCCSCFKHNPEESATPSDWRTVGVWTISSWFQSWPTSTCPHRKSFKARLARQPWPWLQSACTRPDRRHSGSFITGINPRTNEQVWQDRTWKESTQIRGIELLLSLIIIWVNLVASNSTIYLQSEKVTL